MMLLSRPSLSIQLLLWLSVTVAGVYLGLNLKKYINYGIDLVGGTYLTLDVQLEKAVENELVVYMQEVRNRLKKENKELPGEPFVKGEQGILTFSSEAAATVALQAIGESKELGIRSSQEGAALKFEFMPSILIRIKKEAIESNIATLHSRLDPFGAGEIAIVPQGERRIIVELPNVDDPIKAKARIGKSALLEIKPVIAEGRSEQDITEQQGGSLPEGTIVVKDRPSMSGAPVYYLVPQYAELTGNQLKQSNYRMNSGDILTRSTPHLVCLEFKPEGAAKFGELTRQYVGGKLALILDGEVLSAPSVHEEIPSGSAQISGNFTQESAKEMVNMLRSGAFVAPVKVIEERHIGPSLGQESIHRGLVSCGIGLLLLLLFSLFVYKVAGLFAFIVLLYNLVLILFGLALVPHATLTLPGIAGMVLTVGMAIDASILIYERIKEELAHGNSLKQAIKSGFSGATVVILDANITTFIVGFVLYKFGSPAIQGFALTLMIGIVSTLITGLILLKAIFAFVTDVFGIQRLRI